MAFKVLHDGEDCWTTWDEAGNVFPLRFASYDEALKELQDYLVEQHAAVDDGDMLDKYDIEEFDIVEE